MRIAILGGTSQIAKDLILQFSKKTDVELSIFSRNLEAQNKWLEMHKPGNIYKVYYLQDFNEIQKFDAVINFIGTSDIARDSSLSKLFLETTQKYDSIIINYLEKFPNTKYIFLSSGAVYGGDFSEPISLNSVARVAINSPKELSWYGISKLFAECNHRLLRDFSIIDLRIFSYFSHLQNMDTKFLMSEVMASLKNRNTMLVNSHDFVRDYIGPKDFFQMIEKILGISFGNMAIDCYSLKPINKFTLLEILSETYGLKYKIVENLNDQDLNGLKLNYFSMNKTAEKIGYYPEHSSLTGIFEELNKLNWQLMR